MKNLLLLSALFLSLSSIAQLNTYPGNVGFLMNPSFLGPNYQVTNVQYTGHPQSVGSFISDSTNLGFKKGILLTTGLIWGSNGPQGPNDKSSAAYDNGYSGTSLIPDSYNASLLEFDIWSFVDTIEFRYVFGSEEYPEYVGSQFNDQFRIFIEGPGISGIQDLNYIPNNIYAGINTINAGANASYFVNNGNGSEAPFDGSDYYIQYDGFTVPLKAKVAVQSNQVYHISIVVADVADAVFDSGVFIEQCDGCNYNASVPHMSLDRISSYPNPSNGDLTLQFPELTSSSELRIINMLGEVIRSAEVKSGATEFFVNGLLSGTYIVEITSETAVWNGKVSVN